MTFDDLFEQRSLVGAKLKDCMRNAGYSKVALCRKSDISRPTLDRILSGAIDNKSTYIKHLGKILDTLEMSVDEFFWSRTTPNMVDVVYSQNAPADYVMSEKAKKQYDLLMDVLNLCVLYYED